MILTCRTSKSRRLAPHVPNCGIGMVVVIDKADVDAVSAHFKQTGIDNWVIGTIESSTETEPHIEYV